jgi:hypothetical protein
VIRTRGRLVAVVVVGVALVVVLGAASVALGLTLLRSLSPPALADLGVRGVDAGCDDVVRDPGRGIATHVGPGTSEPDRTRVDYDVLPPSSGPHLAAPVYPAAPFYGEDDVPAVEALVHNLEHGYTLVWFDPSVGDDVRADLRAAADLARGTDATRGKLVVAAWDTSRGPLPDGATVVLTHWTADGGVRQACEAFSGETLQRFTEQFPAADSPEPNAP